MAAMMLGDMGADVVRVDRLRPNPMDQFVAAKFAVNSRNCRSIGVDLQKAAGVELVLRLVENADALIEPFRPGVVERLGLGPSVCLARNPKLVYGRMTGWGQEGPLAHKAGHDINYIALTGALHAIGRANDKPLPPLNLVGDFGGGGMLLAYGMLCGLLEASRSGSGQVVDAAMVDGAAALFGLIFGMQAGGAWNEQRGTNMLDSGAHFYEVYETRDRQYVAVGAIEPQFYTALVASLGLKSEELPAQMDSSTWPAMKQRFAAIFASKTRQEWESIMADSDCCFSPVLSAAEAPYHPHAQARGAYLAVDGVLQPAPAPRFSRTQAGAPRTAPRHGEHTDELLGALGIGHAETQSLREAGVVS